MACGTMQLRFFKLGTMLTYAFKDFSMYSHSINFIQKTLSAYLIESLHIIQKDSHCKTIFHKALLNISFQANHVVH